MDHSSAVPQHLSPGNESQLPSLLSLKVNPPEELTEANGTSEVVLPQALEEVLALKTQRALELGTEIEPSTENQNPDLDKEPLLGKEDNVVCVN